MIRFISNKIAKIIGGTIDNTVIGGTTPAPGSFTNITSTQDTVLGGSSTDGRRLRVTKDSADVDVKFDCTTSGKSTLMLSGYNTNTNLATTSGGANISLYNLSATDNNFSAIRSLDSGASTLNMIAFINTSHASNQGTMAFFTRNGGSVTEVGRFDSTGHLLVGTTDNTPYNNSTSAGTGTSIGPNGQIWNHAHNGDLGTWNRTGSDGSVFLINRDGSTVATVSVASGTVTWGTFCGGHNSQFADKSQPEIERGTVISSIDELVEWKTVRWTQKVTETHEDENGDLIETVTGVPKQADYYGPEVVGATFTDDDGNEKTVHAKQADQLPKCEISTVEGDKMVYGTFSHYDENGTPIIHSLGQTVVRVTGPIEAGDLLMSKGDGTACKWVESYGYSAVLGKCRQGAPQAAATDVNLLAYTSMAG
jgi:hypothetical protein